MPTNPSLLIVPYRYKAAKLYSQLPESGAGDFTVTRSTTATRTNASGSIESVASGVPRLDYQGGGCPALLVEPAATNLLLRSEEFDNAYWTALDATVSGGATSSPKGDLTADAITGNGNGTIIRLSSTIVVGTLNATHTVSCFMKKGTNDFALLQASVSGASGTTAVYVDLANGTSPTSGAKVENYGNGWFRVSFTFTLGPVFSNIIIRAFATLSTSVTAFGSNADALGKSIFIWGAQLETGSVATSYIPTAAATATRNADVISLTGASGLIGQTQGTLYAEVDLTEWTNAKRILSISDDSQNNRIAFLINTTNRIRGLVTQGGSTQADFNTSTGLSNGRYKIALAYAANDFVFYVNGSQIGTDTSGSVPACSSVYLGKLETSSSTLQLNDRIRAAALYTSRLSNAELAQLTTL